MTSAARRLLSGTAPESWPAAPRSGNGIQRTGSMALRLDSTSVGRGVSSKEDGGVPCRKLGWPKEPGSWTRDLIGPCPSNKALPEGRPRWGGTGYQASHAAPHHDRRARMLRRGVCSCSGSWGAGVIPWKAQHRQSASSFKVPLPKVGSKCGAIVQSPTQPASRVHHPR